MKLKTDRAAFLKALAHIRTVAKDGDTIPILGNVLISAKEGHMSLTTTDMEIAIVEAVAAHVSRAGSTTVPASMLYEIVRKLPDGAQIEMDHPDRDAPLVLRAGRYATRINVLPVEDFPSITAGHLPSRFRISASVLCSLIDRTRFAISTEKTRYYLNGLYLHVADGEVGPVMRAVATDGHRLACVETKLPDGAAGMPGVIVPRKTINELRKLLDELADDVELSLSETCIQFALGNVTLTSKLIDGTFPEYERVIPRDNDKILRVGKRDFSDAVARVAAIGQERSQPVKLTMGHNLLTLSADSPDQGAAKEELDDEKVTYDSTPLEIGFQARYLTDITDQIEQYVEFSFSDGPGAAIVRDLGDLSATYVLMSMRV